MKATARPAVLALILCAGAAADAGAQTATATLVNGTSLDIHQMYLSPSHESQWGPDQLGEYVLERGMSFSLSDIPCGEYDLMLVDEDGDECEVVGMYLCGDMGEKRLTDKELLECEGFETTASATLVNRSRYDIYALFVSPSDHPQWGPDQLQEYVLESGMTFTLTDITCGDYDVKLVDEDGDECVLDRVFLCGAEEAVVTDRELLDCEGY